jgi:hypothetical protein
VVHDAERLSTVNNKGERMKHSAVVAALILGVIIGGLVSAATVSAEHERVATVYDSHGQAVHVGDVIIGSTGVPVKVHGFTSTYRAGTFAAYADQVRLCPDCAWVETAPDADASTASNKLRKKPSVFGLAFDLLTGGGGTLHAQDGYSIIWGS